MWPLFWFSGVLVFGYFLTWLSQLLAASGIGQCYAVLSPQPLPFCWPSSLPAVFPHFPPPSPTYFHLEQVAQLSAFGFSMLPVRFILRFSYSLLPFLLVLSFFLFFFLFVICMVVGGKFWVVWIKQGRADKWLNTIRLLAADMCRTRDPKQDRTERKTSRMEWTTMKGAEENTRLGKSPSMEIPSQG